MLRKTLSSFSLGVFFAACSSPTQQTSSSSHWATCHELDDCSALPEAVACTSGYCVDGSGNRILANPAEPPTPNDDAGPTGSGDDAASNGSGNGSCDPLAPQELPVTLGTVLGVGKAPDGTTYLVDEVTSPSILDRVFVSEGNALVRKRVTGSGSKGGAPDQMFYTFSVDDGAAGMAVLLATEMGQATAMGLGPANSKGFIDDPRAVTTQLTVLNRSVVSDFALTNLPGEQTVEYVADVEGGSVIVVTRPTDEYDYEDFRLFWGSEGPLSERRVINVTRTRIGDTTIQFEGDVSLAAMVVADFTWVPDPENPHPGPGTLKGAGPDQSMSQRFPTPTTLTGMTFTCR